MLIAQENNIEHYPIVFNVFLLLPIPKKILCIFYQTSPRITPEWHTKCIECTNIEFERQLFSYTLYRTCRVIHNILPMNKLNLYCRKIISSFSSSIWLSRKGMKWVLSCFANICDWVPRKDLLYKRYGENNKFFEFRGRSNKAGIFMEIVVFFGGA